jgi:uncharacterized protein (DUF488 family)
VLTIGHSTRPIEDFLRLLTAHGVTRLIDVRTVPRSRFNPQFDNSRLPGLLRKAQIQYTHLPALGGLRRPQPDSPNTGWRNKSFRGYADHMQTATFAAGLEQCLAFAAAERVVLMCAEAVPWRCHRSLIADALVARGIDALEIVSESRARPHTLTPFARLDGTAVTYPATPMEALLAKPGPAEDKDHATPSRQVAPDRWQRASR